MDKEGQIDRLLADEEFQDEILKVDGMSDEERKVFLHKYAISEKELAYAKRLLSALSFRKAEISQEEIGYALQKLVKDLPSNKILKGRNIFTILTRIAAIMFIPLLLSSLFFYNKTKNLQLEYFSSSTQEESYNTVHAPAGVKTQVVLPDGSLVWLNSGSSLSYPFHFDRKIRQLKLTGDAYFEVAKNAKVPMIVSVDNMKVKVYGTRFNVNAISESGFVETTLVDGKITIIPDKSGKEYLLKPGYTASYTVSDQKLTSKKVENMDSFIGWKDGKLLFQNEYFTDIVHRLERWYNVDIQLTDESLGKYVLYATFVDQNIEQVLDILSYSIPIRVEYRKMIKKSDGTYQKREIIIKRDTNKKIK